MSNNGAEVLILARYDDDGNYMGEVPYVQLPGTLPPENSTEILPENKPGYIAKWGPMGWDYIEDHRGKIMIRKDLTSYDNVDFIGPIPEEYTLIPPLQMMPGYDVRWNGEDWEYVEDHRGKVGWLNGEIFEITELGPIPSGWSTEEPKPDPVSRETIEDTRTVEEKRRSAYAEETDRYVRQIQGYKVEAEALRLAGDTASADKCESEAAVLMAEYLAKKQEIRDRIKG